MYLADVVDVKQYLLTFADVVVCSGDAISSRTSWRHGPSGDSEALGEHTRVGCFAREETVSNVVPSGAPIGYLASMLLSFIDFQSPTSFPESSSDISVAHHPFFSPVICSKKFSSLIL